jgi:hypothetical protein
MTQSRHHPLTFGRHRQLAPRDAVAVDNSFVVSDDEDLSSLTKQMAALLTILRQEHGVVYRSRTWIDDVLPGFGGRLPNPELARDLLAVAALDAGGIRADVSGLVAHDHVALVTTAQAVRKSLQHVLVACEGWSDIPPPPPPDQPCWAVPE